MMLFKIAMSKDVNFAISNTKTMNTKLKQMALKSQQMAHEICIRCFSVLWLERFLLHPLALYFMSKIRLIAGLDIGSSKIRTVV